jgi:peptide deformylase
MILPIAKYPDPILRVPGKEVTFPLSPSVKKLVSDMFETVRKAGGIGLAAPQVNKSLRLIVVDLESLGLPPFALFNPKIVSSSRKKHNGEEGCLSIPKVFGMIERPEKITFEGKDITGKTIKIECDGMLATVVQHETDHVNGILIVDKISEYTQGKELLEKMEKKKK